MSARHRATLVKRGYTVEPTMFIDTDEHPTVYAVSGHGISLHVSEDDDDSWRSLTKKKAHDERVKQMRELAG